MRICLVTPAPPGSRKGNRITALRWAHILRSLSHRVSIEQNYRGQGCELLVALHARRSFPSVRRYRKERPDGLLIVALTGTDLYKDIRTSARARESLELADRLIVLQPMGLLELPEAVRGKARVIYQSVELPPSVAGPGQGCGGKGTGSFVTRHSSEEERRFEVCVLGHLRGVKDPFRAAIAARRLPRSSRIQVIQIGGALTKSMAVRAEAEQASNPRYRWLGELPRSRAVRRLALTRLLVLTSRMEGGANAISEAVAASVPVISSRISGSIGMLGDDYPGYFEYGKTRELAAMMLRAEMDPAFYADLKARCAALKPLFEAAREREAWAFLLEEIGRK